MRKCSSINCRVNSWFRFRRRFYVCQVECVCYVTLLRSRLFGLVLVCILSMFLSGDNAVSGSDVAMLKDVDTHSLTHWRTLLSGRHATALVTTTAWPSDAFCFLSVVDRWTADCHSSPRRWSDHIKTLPMPARTAANIPVVELSERRGIATLALKSPSPASEYTSLVCCNVRWNALQAAAGESFLSIV